VADLFDQKSLRIPPMMGKAARTKLNKSGSYRMPPNLKGVHSAAQGGLGGAYTKGKKLRGYAEGGLVGVGGEEIKPTQANFSSGLGDTPEEELTQEIQDESPEAAQSALDYVGSLKSPSNMNPDDIPASMDLGSKRIQEELSKYMPYARQQLEGMQNPREGGLNLPMLQFAAGLMSPTRTGSFGESIVTGMNMGLNALANQRKQDLDYQTLKAKLGLDIEKTPLEVATKLADLEQRREYQDALMDWRKNKPAATKEPRTLPANTVEKVLKQADTVSQLGTLKNSYQPGFGGTVFEKPADFQNWIGTHTVDEKDPLFNQAMWWKEYNNYAQFVRHELYGSAFTKAEQDAWDRATITPGMSDAAIQRNMDIRHAVANKAIQRRIGGFGAAGYKTDDFGEYINQSLAEDEQEDTQKDTPEKAAPKIPEGYTQDKIEEYKRLRGIK